MVMRLSLIGMSGSGKSHWSLKLERRGFRRFCCDDLIAQRLAPRLKTPGRAVKTVGQWLGFPYDAGYGGREALYLARERKVLANILTSLEGRDAERDIVVDTTGSVIYTGGELLSALRRLTTVVHLATPPEARDRLLETYLTDQRPVLWHGVFSKRPGESDDEALIRCYPLLLASRERLYEQHADVTIGYQQQRRESFGVSDLLEMALAT